MDGKSKKSKDGDMISKFQGDGMLFRAKLYGSLDVKEARGDVMCQQSLQLLKNNNGTHKQKILLKVNLKGMTMIDSASSAVLHQHPVNRISFISKDRADNRSFAYVVGLNEGAHVLFGVKTEKAADAVVLALRDLFQAVYQLSQKETQSQRSGSRTSSQSLDSQNNQNNSLAATSASSNLSINSPDNPSSFPKLEPALSHTPNKSLNGANNATQPPTMLNADMAVSLSPPITSPSPSQASESNLGFTPVVSQSPTNDVTESNPSHSELEPTKAYRSALVSLTSPPSRDEDVSSSVPEVPITASPPAPEDPFMASNPVLDDPFNEPKSAEEKSVTTCDPEQKDPSTPPETSPQDLFITPKLTPQDPFPTPETKPPDPFTSPEINPQDLFTTPETKTQDPFPLPETKAQDLFTTPEMKPQDPFTSSETKPQDPFTTPETKQHDPFPTPETKSQDPFTTPEIKSPDSFTTQGDPFAAAESTSVDPFTTSVDPFTTAEDPFTTAEDPFTTAEDPFTVSQTTPVTSSAFNSSNPWGASDTWKSNDSWNPFAPDETNITEPQHIIPTKADESLSAAAVDVKGSVSPVIEAGKTESGSTAMQNEADIHNNFTSANSTLTTSAAAGEPGSVDTLCNVAVNKESQASDSPSAEVELNVFKVEDAVEDPACHSIKTKTTSEASPFESMNNPWENSNLDPFSDFAVSEEKFDPFAAEGVFGLNNKELCSSKIDDQQPSSSNLEFSGDASVFDTESSGLANIDPFDDGWFKGINKRQPTDITQFHNADNHFPDENVQQVPDVAESNSSTVYEDTDKKEDGSIKNAKLLLESVKPDVQSQETDSDGAAAAKVDAAGSSIELTEKCDKVSNEDIPHEFEPPSCLAPSLPSDVSDSLEDVPPPSMPAPTVPPPAMPPRKAVPPAVPKRRLSSGLAPPIPNRPTAAVSPNQSTVPKVDAFVENNQTGMSEPPSLPPPSVPPPSAPLKASPPSLPPRVPHRANT